MTNTEALFLEELTALSRKHGIKIDGCGCCGSPYLSDLDDEDKHPKAKYVTGKRCDEGRILWTWPGCYEWEEHQAPPEED